MKLYFDANVLIRAIEGDDQIAQRLGALFDRAEDGDCTIVTSELSLAEIMVGPFQALEIDPADARALARQRLYLSFGEGDNGIEVLSIGRPVLLEAALLRAKRLSLKLPDAIHLATHISADCDVFVSGDRRLGAAATSALSMRGSVCSLEEPELAALSYRITG